MLAWIRPVRLCFVVFLVVFATACVPVSSTPAALPPTAAPAAVTRLTLWHAYGGALGKSFEALVQQFNQTHPAIQVEPR